MDRCAAVAAHPIGSVLVALSSRLSSAECSIAHVAEAEADESNKNRIVDDERWMSG